MVVHAADLIDLAVLWLSILSGLDVHSFFPVLRGRRIGEGLRHGGITMHFAPDFGAAISEAHECLRQVRVQDIVANQHALAICFAISQISYTYVSLRFYTELRQG
jgi:hypothetical protein